MSDGPMNAERLLSAYEKIADAPDAIARLLAVQPTMMTVAPDVVEEAAWLELQRSGTRLSLGHSDCTEAQASRAFEKVGHWGGLTVRACLLSRISSTL